MSANPEAAREKVLSMLRRAESPQEVINEVSSPEVGLEFLDLLDEISEGLDVHDSICDKHEEALIALAWESAVDESSGRYLEVEGEDQLEVVEGVEEG